jgi:glycosyltransferase involved in cell wall biosynthesis
LLERWIDAQTYDEPYQWVTVCDGGFASYRFSQNQTVLRREPRPREKHSLTRNLPHALPHLRGDRILCIEDDDYYAGDYLAVMNELLETAPLVGLVPARYYSVRHARWREFGNFAHASLATTGFTREVLPLFQAICARGSPYIDRQLWQSWRGPRRLERIPLHVGVKGMPGEPGIGTGHADDAGGLDADRRIFRAWGLPEVYRQFHAAPRPPAQGRVKVGIACGDLWPGGAERWMAELVRHTDPSRLDWRGVAVAAARPGSPEAVAELSRYLPVRTGGLAVYELAREVDVLVVWIVDQLALHIPCRPRRPRVVGVSHSPAESAWARTAYAGLAADVDRWAAVSAAALGAVPAAGRAQAVVIRNAVAADRVRSQHTRETIRERWGIPHDAKVVGMLARLSAEKRPEALVDAIAHLPEDWFGLLAGAGQERSALEARIGRMCPGRVWLAGVQSSADVLLVCDTILVPSDFESFGYAIAEAWLAGVPVVATPVGVAAEQPDLVRHVPHRASGRLLAEAIRADQAAPHETGTRVARARTFAERELAPAAFGCAWTDFLVAEGQGVLR